jgi:SNF2 family DNA or RNA helicase
LFVTNDAKWIVVPWNETLANLVPTARDFAHHGQRMLLLPNEHAEAKVARQIGIAVPAPVLTRYNWRGHKPWAVQKISAALLTESPRAYVLSDFGTGKTRTALWAADYLMLNDPKVKRTLIAAPLSTLTPTWESELFKLFPRAKVQLLYGDKQTRLKRLAEDADFYIINHHGLSLLREQLAARGFGVFVLDELAVFRNKKTDLWKAANAIIRGGAGIPYVWGMTASPRPKAPTDAWGQIKLLTPDTTTQTFTRFRDMTMMQMSAFKWAARKNANDIVFAQMQPSVRFSLNDVTELPPTTYRTVEVPLEPGAASAYKQMVQKMITLTKGGETITAVNEAALQSKLLQVATGYIYTDKHGTCRLPNQTRLDAMVEIIEANSQKVIVFCPFKHTLSGVAAELQKKKISFAMINGDTPVFQRNKVFKDFMETPDPFVIAAHPGCMSHGLTLTAASTVIWYGPINNFEIYQQANARIIRPGQTSKTTVIHLVGTPVEKLMHRRLQEKGTFQGLLLELFQQQELEF